MIDYLELLLEEQESEETSQVSEWKQMKIPLMNATRQDGERSEVESVQSVGYAQDKTRVAQAERTAEERIDFENGPFQMRDVTVELVRLRRAVRQAESRNGRAMEWSGSTAGGDAGFSWMGGKPNFKAVDYAALVDAAFARDARRYDGLPGLL